jgi:hypothetical protein
MAFNNRSFFTATRSAFLAASALVAYPTLMNFDQAKPKTRPFSLFQNAFNPQNLMRSNLTQALHPETENTNVYVWGEGYQVDASMEFTNFTPKKIRPF